LRAAAAAFLLARGPAARPAAVSSALVPDSLSPGRASVAVPAAPGPGVPAGPSGLASVSTGVVGSPAVPLAAVGVAGATAGLGAAFLTTFFLV